MTRKPLRSGKFKQGVLKLKRKTESGEYAYCCLGVMCELQGLPFEESELNGVYSVSGIKNPEDVGTAGLIQEACDYWGVDSSLGHFDDVLERPKSVEKHSNIGRASNLSWLNDTGYTFEQIADIIELNHRLL